MHLDCSVDKLSMLTESITTYTSLTESTTVYNIPVLMTPSLYFRIECIILHQHGLRYIEEHNSESRCALSSERGKKKLAQPFLCACRKQRGMFLLTTD